MNKKIWFCLFVLMLGTQVAAANEIKTLVEFFSYNYSHCAAIDNKLNSYIAKNRIKYLAVNIDNSPSAIPANIMYYMAVDAGVGEQFKAAYFRAVSKGMPAYANSTLNHVVSQVQNDTMKNLIHSKSGQQHIKQKLLYAQSLLEIHKVTSAPSFLINQTTLLEGADVITSLIRDDND